MASRIILACLCSLAARSHAAVSYAVFPVGANPTCNESLISGGVQPHELPDKVAIGSCQEFGMGKSAYNSIKILGCSSDCLCFEQVAANDSTVGCDKSRTLGHNIKESCFSLCLQDCNGNNCGDTATTSGTKLRLLGSGQICDDPKSDAEYTCATTGMIENSASAAGNATIEPSTVPVAEAPIAVAPIAVAPIAVSAQTRAAASALALVAVGVVAVFQ
eukprot:Hpha_TRINITY_DN27631_c0_g1::TRINITY_DN27631_c0_g1_i1::g.57397::m.57397